MVMTVLKESLWHQKKSLVPTQANLEKFFASQTLQTRSTQIFDFQLGGAVTFFGIQLGGAVTSLFTGMRRLFLDYLLDGKRLLNEMEK